MQTKETKWSWLVLAMICLTNFLTLGYILGSIGVFVRHYNEHYDADNTISGWFGAVAGAMIFGFSPVSAVILHKLGVRLTIIVSTATAVVGLVATAFATEIWHAILSFSILTSASLCTAHIASIATIPLHFDIHINFAFTAQVAGAAAGKLAFPLITQQLLQKLTYRDAMLTQAAMCAACIFGAVIYRIPLNTSGPVSTASKQTRLDALKTTFKRIGQLRLIFYFLNRFCWNAGLLLFVVYLYNYIAAEFNSHMWAGVAMNLLGVGQLIIALLMSFVNGRIETNKYLVHLISVVLASVCALSMAFSNNVVLVVCLTGAVGTFYGLTMCNDPSLVQHLNGQQAVHVIYSVSQLSAGLGSISAPPIVAALQSRYQLPLSSLFFFSAALAFGSCLLMTLLLVIKRDEVWHPKPIFLGKGLFPTTDSMLSYMTTVLQFGATPAEQNVGMPSPAVPLSKTKRSENIDTETQENGENGGIEKINN